MKKSDQTSFGFTLIELLIVVAIIAILAAIAVPNFLEAQARSKVARAKNDIRSIVSAMESYVVDTNRYPEPANDSGQVLFNPTPGDPIFYETRIPYLLTTPVAYLSSLPRDIFTHAPIQENPNFHYSSRLYQERRDGSPANWFVFHQHMVGHICEHTKYHLSSHGPDLSHSANYADAALYDPTNGTVSVGDIVYMGPCFGFQDNK